MISPTALVTMSILATTGLLALVARWLWRRWRKGTFAEYATKVVRFELADDGAVDFAQWLHPRDRDIEISQQRVHAMRTLVRPGDTVIDIGAYTGDTTVPLALAVGPTGCVLALEPNPHVFKVLAANAALNRDKTNIEPLNFAATEQDGTYTFHYCDASFCNGGFLSQINNRRHGHQHALQVQGKDLSAWLRREKLVRLSRLSLIKVDAEGYDRQVLLSLADVIKRYRPAIICEVYKRLDQSEREALYDTLVALGYDCFKLASETEDLRGEMLQRGAMMRWKHFDIVALPQEASQRAAA
jgi:FkbM family methyltransferase